MNLFIPCSGGAVTEPHFLGIPLWKVPSGKARGTTSPLTLWSHRLLSRLCLYIRHFSLSDFSDNPLSVWMSALAELLTMWQGQLTLRLKCGAQSHFNHLVSGCPTHFHRGLRQPHGCLQRAECHFMTVYM